MWSPDFFRIFQNLHIFDTYQEGGDLGKSAAEYKQKFFLLFDRKSKFPEEVNQMKAFGNGTPFFWDDEMFGWSKALSSSEAIGAVPGSHPHNIHHIY